MLFYIYLIANFVFELISGDAYSFPRDSLKVFRSCVDFPKASRPFLPNFYKYQPPTLIKQEKQSHQKAFDGFDIPTESHLRSLWEPTSANRLCLASCPNPTYRLNW